MTIDEFFKLQKKREKNLSKSIKRNKFSQIQAANEKLKSACDWKNRIIK